MKIITLLGVELKIQWLMRASNINVKPYADSFFDTNKLKGKYASSYYTKMRRLSKK